MDERVAINPVELMNTVYSPINYWAIPFAESEDDKKLCNKRTLLVAERTKTLTRQ